MIKKKYPMTEKERQGCLIEIARMTALRDMYRERLENEFKPKV